MWKKLQHGSQGDKTPTSSSRSQQSTTVAWRAGSSPVLHNQAQLGASASKTAQRSPQNMDQSKGPYGLTVVYEPVVTHVVDIIFVHGLGGGSSSTWSWEHDPETFWPGTFLPHDIPDARVLTFGYDASFRSKSNRSFLSLRDNALTLLSELANLPNSSPEPASTNATHLGGRRAPIIFVAHSFGGLIVKQAYVLGSRDSTYKEIIASTHSFVFLATPHRGSNVAGTLTRILNTSIDGSAKGYLAELEKASFSIQETQDDFRYYASKLEIYSFYETRITSIGRSRALIVEKDSAVLGWAGERTGVIDADHREICKFRSPQDSSYVTVRNALQSLIENCISSSAVSDTRLQNILAVNEVPHSDYLFFRDRWSTETCSWILTDVTFKAWLKAERGQSQILWICGPPGIGKSVLASFVIDHLLESGYLCQYFFFRYDSQEKRSAQTLLHTLAYQLAVVLPSYAESIRKLALAGTDLIKADWRVIWKLLFKTTLFSQRIEQPLYWIIDGLDETDNGAEILQLFAELEVASFPIQILCLSRRTMELVTAFNRLAATKTVQTGQLDMDAASVANDVRAYIEAELKMSLIPVGTRNQLVSELTTRANGNLLWTSLVLEEVKNSHTFQDVEDAIEQVPTSIVSLYDRVASSIASLPPASHDLAKNILGWVLCTKRPLTVAELRDALGDKQNILELEHAIVRLCGSLVVINKDGQISMVHATAREYFHTRADGPFAVSIPETHAMIFERCMYCLSQHSLRQRLARHELTGLLQYAASFWFIHAVQGDNLLEANARRIAGFFSSPSVLTWIHATCELHRLKTLVQASRYIATLVAKLERGLGSGFAPDFRGRELLREWSVDLVRLVGKFGQTLLKHPDCIYRIIPPLCPHGSALYRQFGSKEASNLAVNGITNTQWDDNVARLNFEHGSFATLLSAAGNHISVATAKGNLAQIQVYDELSFEEQTCLKHPERILFMRFNSLGNRLLSFGIRATRLWDVATGSCDLMVSNPRATRIMDASFIDEQTLIGVFEDQTVRRLGLEGTASTEWDLVTEIKHENAEQHLRRPVYASLSPNVDLVAIGFRGQPMAVWELGETDLSGPHVFYTSSSTSTADNITGNVQRLAWHPFEHLLFGLNLEGFLFKCDLLKDATNAKECVAKELAVSPNGSVIATGDHSGTIKIYATESLNLLYVLISEGDLTQLCFSADSSRLYDIRKTYGNVWEPAMLAQAGISREIEFDDMAVHTDVGIPEALGSTPAKKDFVTLIEPQLHGDLCCFANEAGLAFITDLISGRQMEVLRPRSLTGVAAIAWSTDDRRVAVFDLSGHLSVHEVDASSGNVFDDPLVLLFSAKVELTTKGPCQLLFQAEASNLLLALPSSVHIYELGTSQTLYSNSAPDFLGRKWVRHPDYKDLSLAFGPIDLLVVHWSDQGFAGSTRVVYYPADSVNEVVLPEHDSVESTRFAVVGNPIVSQDGSSILVSRTSGQPDRSVGSEHMCITTGDIDRACDASQDMGKGQLNAVSYQLLGDHGVRTAPGGDGPAPLRQPLAIQHDQRLVYIDNDAWISSKILLPTTHAGAINVDKQGKVQTTPLPAVARHFFIPSDWISGDEKLRWRLTSKGVLVGARDDNVAAIKDASLACKGARKVPSRIRCPYVKPAEEAAELASDDDESEVSSEFGHTWKQIGELDHKLHIIYAMFEKALLHAEPNAEPTRLARLDVLFLKLKIWSSDAEHHGRSLRQVEEQSSTIAVATSFILAEIIRLLSVLDQGSLATDADFINDEQILKRLEQTVQRLSSQILLPKANNRVADWLDSHTSLDDPDETFSIRSDILSTAASSISYNPRTWTRASGEDDHDATLNSQEKKFT